MVSVLSVLSVVSVGVAADAWIRRAVVDMRVNWQVEFGLFLFGLTASALFIWFRLETRVGTAVEYILGAKTEGRM